jgi:hypothetical protein
MEDTLMMEPPPARTRCGRAAWLVSMAPVTLTANTWSHGPEVMPALFTSASSRPARAANASTASVTAPSSVMSAITGTAVPWWSAMTAQVASARSRLMSRTPVSAP